ncbi:hypothetical protein PFISCL1PPCAC_1889 [Pristionchus fissidentatus]|uniref:Cap-specific mRNA (nucleoside-2'-O-)-methyltransferase 1 n=1 Tax=Pristionchus fissidentatus TaxID=1538716 RepID=A0AAV5UVG8_9BILA|nr:hypothetical protein PFISCL1PPCAC_1889 [Pristionchus fissidentatus]
MGDEKRPPIEVVPQWIRATHESRERLLKSLEKDEWRAEIERKKATHSLADERLWCDDEKFDRLGKMKQSLSEFDSNAVEEVRMRSNPHEPLLANKIMFGRYSILLASIDRVFDFLLTDENIDDVVTKRPLDTRPRGKNIDRESELFYFAESQTLSVPFASQYIWLRKGFYNAKCYSPELAPTAPICCLTSHSLLDTVKRVGHQLRGQETLANPYEPAIKEAFTDLVMRGTRGEGVNLYAGFGMSTYAFPEYENGDQGTTELLFRDSYVGQLLYASSIVKAGGKAILHFLDSNTSLSMAVLYLAHIIFDRVSIYKPNMSRPSNAEKFLICDGLRSKEAKAIRKYLEASLERVRPDESLIRLIPDGVMEEDENFREYVIEALNQLADRQYRFMESYLRMLNDDSRENSHQKECLDKCLPYYLIPYATSDEMKNLSQELKQRRAEEILRNWIPEGTNYEDLLNSMSKGHSKMNQQSFKKKLESRSSLLVTPCADSVTTLIVVTNNGIEFWSGEKGKWIEMSKLTTTLPPDTVLIGDVIEANNGRSLIVRIIDVGVIFGDDISTLPFKKRLKAAEKVVEACRKDGARQDVHISVAHYESVDQSWRPNLIPDRVTEDPIYFMKRKIRLIEDSSTSFYSMINGENAWEI